MKVYIEDVIVDNLVINFIILFLTKKIFKTQTKNVFLILGSIIGTISSIIFCIFDINGFALILFKLFTSVLMVLSSFEYICFKKFFIKYISFIFNTAMFGGICFLISFSIGESASLNGILTYDLSLPMGFVILLAFFVSYVFCKILNSLKHKSKIEALIYNTILRNDNKQLEIKAYFDTGNTLVDSKSGKPVFIITYKNFYKLFDLTLESLIQGKVEENLKDAHYINVGSVGKSSKMLVFCIDEIEIYESKNIYKIKKPMLALSYQNLEQKINCGMILNSNFKECV